MPYPNNKIDFNKDQHLMSIRSKDVGVSHVEISNGKIVTNGFVGENEYDDFVDLIRGLQGYGIKIDDFYF